MTKKILFDRKLLIMLSTSLVAAVALLSGTVLNPLNHYLLGFLLVGLAVALYFVQVLFGTERNWMDIRAVFTGVWLATVGLAALRLTNYQEEWQTMTWVWLAVAYAVFAVGSTLGMTVGTMWFSKVHEKLSGLRLGRVILSEKKERLFWVCIIATLVGIAAFIGNAMIKGYVPFFSSDPHAYTNFYTRLQIFSVAAQAVSGLCYYCIRTQKISVWKKALLAVCILYHVIVYPVLIVSRGTFLAAAISLTVAVFYLHGKKFVALILCLAVMFGVYLGCSRLRNYSDDQLVSFFEPVEIEIEEDEEESDSTDEEADEGIVFTLPPKVAWVYSYLTVSHDNFNEIVQNLEHYTWGTRQLVPINVILRSDWIEQQNASAEQHRVREHLNTNNLIGEFYYDFGGIGVILSMLFWSFLFGMNQGLYEKYKNWTYLLLLGNTAVPVMLSFFASWTSIFSQWVLWGVVLIFALGASFTVRSKKN